VLYALGVLIFAVGLLASIALHEVGHMVPAKKFGVKVTQYMVGFGPTLWSRKRGDTEYGIKALPLGGYIRMIGMVPPRVDGKRSRWPRRLASAVEDFRSMSRAEVEPEDGPREFYRLTPGKKIIVMLGGPVMNLIIYIVLTVVLLSTIGLSHSDPTTKVDSIYQCVLPVNDPNATATSCPAGAAHTPAYNAGLRPGDTITAIDGQSVTSWDQTTKIIKASTGKALAVTVERNGAPLTLTLTPVANTVAANNSGSKLETAGYIGVEAALHNYFKIVGPAQIPGQIVSQVALGLHAIGSYPSKIHSLWQTVFEGKPRNPEGAVGVVGIGRIGGQVAASHQFNLTEKISVLIGLLAAINLLLFFFNLLPLLPLDGGHVAGALVEAFKRGRARLRAHSLARDGHPADPDAPPRPPIFVDTAQMLPVMYAVASVLIVLTLLTLYADVVKPINVVGG
jgi:membrane-associated protease RseP (regulator of RpoE activity)